MVLGAIGGGIFKGAGDILSKRVSEEVKEYSGSVTSLQQKISRNKEIQKLIKKLGFRGYHVDEPGTVGLFYPDKGDVRSIFAKFDPKKSKSGNILASVPIAAMGIDALSELEDD